MKRIIRSVRSTMGKVIILCAFALSLLGDTSSAIGAFDHEKSGAARHWKHRHKGESDIVSAHGFIADNGDFKTIDAPGAGLFTIAFGIDDRGRTTGAYVDRGGTLHGFLYDECDFKIIDFPGARATFAARINDRGVIVGAYSNESNTPATALHHGFLLRDGEFTEIDFPNARRTQPYGVNNHGHIVGEYADADGVSHGFLLKNGVFTTIDFPDGLATVATDINDRGQIVGYYTDADGLLHGFLRDGKGGFTSINVPDGAQTQAFGINNRGQIVGYFSGATIEDRRKRRGFLLDDGAFNIVNFPDARPLTFLFDINDRGRLAGAYDLVVHGYLRDERGEFTIIDVPTVVVETAASDINNFGLIVGAADEERAGNFSGFLRDQFGRLIRIAFPGAAGSVAIAINDRGQILGNYSETTSDTQVAPDLRGFLFDRGAFISIDFPGAVVTNPLDIDNLGRIVGEYRNADGAFHSFLRDSSGSFTNIDIPGATATSISGINERGQMIGIYVGAAGAPHAFLLDNGVVTHIDFPNATVTAPLGLNNHGQIVGVYTDNTGTHAFLLSNGEFIEITPPGAPSQFIAAFDIDDRGRIVGAF